jgi:trimeric autotransporter adhesin
MQRRKLLLVGVLALVGALATIPVAAQPTLAPSPWLLGGNALAVPDKEYLGTSNNTPLVIKVNGERALLIEPNAASPNLVGGYAGNTVAAGIAGAVIGGGGSKDFPNRVLFSYGTVGGGYGNEVGFGDTVAGGASNVATGQSASIGGGFGNKATGEGSTVAGGVANATSATRATVGGGNFNTASGQYSSVAGGFQNTAEGEYASVGGGQNNTAVANATVGGGNTNSGSAELATVGGGEFNNASALGAVVGGGSGNAASGTVATIGGGFGNAAGSAYATVGGGNSNRATAPYATIAGGGRSVETNFNTGNRVTDSHGTVGGGGNNQAGDNAGSSADRPYATVGGGRDNLATGSYATVNGGYNNRGAGAYATVGGGIANLASGAYSYAAGFRAKATQAGSWVWADASPFDFSATRPNQFNVRATGGTRIVSAVNGSGAPAAGVELAPGSGAWSTLSDRAVKADILAVDPRTILARLAAVPITTWRYRTQDASVRHIGPMAQDFYAAFGVGEDARHISTVDADGVALAAIQALTQENAALHARVAALERAAPIASTPPMWVFVLGGMILVNALAMGIGVALLRRRAA